MNRAMIAVVGMAGSGKSTMCRPLAKALELRYMPTGDGIRKLAEQDSEVKEALDRGEFAPKEKMNQFMMNWMREELEQGPILLDGYPRYNEQLYDFVATAFAMQADPYMMVVHCDENVARERLLKRQRYDDTDAPIRKRHAGFWKETWPVVELGAIMIGGDRICNIHQGEPEAMLEAAITYFTTRIYASNR